MVNKSVRTLLDRKHHLRIDTHFADIHGFMNVSCSWIKLRQLERRS